MVDSDQPVAVVVDDLSLNGDVDQSIYLGMPESDRRDAALPLVLRGGRLSDVQPIVGPAPTPTPAPPLVGLPVRMPAPSGDHLDVPVSFDARGRGIADMSLRLDYDESWLRFDTADSDGNGVPDAVLVDLPGGVRGICRARPGGGQRRAGDPRLVDGRLARRAADRELVDGAARRSRVAGGAGRLTGDRAYRRPAGTNGFGM